MRRKPVARSRFGGMATPSGQGTRRTSGQMRLIAGHCHFRSAAGFGVKSRTCAMAAAVVMLEVRVAVALRRPRSWDRLQVRLQGMSWGLSGNNAEKVPCSVLFVRIAVCGCLMLTRLASRRAVREWLRAFRSMDRNSRKVFRNSRASAYRSGNLIAAGHGLGPGGMCAGRMRLAGGVDGIAARGPGTADFLH
jgi:hypothetical protein